MVKNRPAADGGAQFRITDGDGQAWATTGDATPDATFATVPTTTTYYIQIKRTSSTAYTIGIYSDSAYSTLTEEETGTVSATSTGYRYLLIQNFNASVVDINFNGTIDDVQFIDGQSTPP